MTSAKQSGIDQSRALEGAGIEGFAELSGAALTGQGKVEAFRDALVNRVAAVLGESPERSAARLEAAGVTGDGLVALGDSAHRLGRSAVQLGAALAGSLMEGQHPHDIGVRSMFARSVVDTVARVGEIEIEIVPLALGVLHDRRVLVAAPGRGREAPSAELDALIDLPFIPRADGSLASPADFFRLDQGVRDIDSGAPPALLGQVAVEPYQAAREAIEFADQLRLGGSRYAASAIEQRIPLEAIRLIFEKGAFERSDMSPEGLLAVHLLDTVVGCVRMARDECVRARISPRA